LFTKQMRRLFRRKPRGLKLSRFWFRKSPVKARVLHVDWTRMTPIPQSNR